MLDIPISLHRSLCHRSVFKKGCDCRPVSIRFIKNDKEGRSEENYLDVMTYDIPPGYDKCKR